MRIVKLFPTTLIVCAALGAALEARANVFLSNTDRSATIELSADRLSARFLTSPAQRGVRSDVAIQPGQGFYYFEGSRSEAAGDYTFGVATAAELLTNSAGQTVQSAGANFNGGPLRYSINSSGNLTGTFDTMGFAVDYRGPNPVVHLIASTTLTGDAVYVGTVTMTSVTTPIYIFLSGRPTSTGFRQTINGGNDLTARPFRYSAAQIAAALNGRFYRGNDGLVLGWPTTPNANLPGTVNIAGGPRAIVLGSPVTISASATDPEDGNRTASITWSDGRGNTGSGASFTFTPAVLGRTTVVASATDTAGLIFNSNVVVTVISNSAIDADGDGLSQAEEATLGTNPANTDSDQDGLSDNVEVNTHHSNPLDTDSDHDGIADGYEITHGLSINSAADATLDRDGDSYTNLAEYTAGTSASSNTSYPNRGVVRLSATDRDSGVTLSPDRLGASFSGAGVHGVRSEVSIAPNSGWYYFEGRRGTTTLGNYGFGVASASASLAAAGGSNDQSIGVDTQGRIFYNGAQFGTFADTVLTSNYGIAINYSGANPIVYVVTECTPVRITSFSTPDGWSCSSTPGTPGGAGGAGIPVRVSAPITMSNVTGPLFALVYGDSATPGFIASINGGGTTAGFSYPANYVLFNEGITGAEFMGTGFGPENTYAGRIIPPTLPRVHFARNPQSTRPWESPDMGIRLSPDLLGASYTTVQKGAIRANQGMIGEFRYWEAHREIDPTNFGQGMLTAYTQTNPYCFNPQQPSMSLNSAGGMWRNLLPRTGESFNTTANSYYGFAVDYRGARPIVRTIVGGAIVSTMTLDTFTPLFPTIYGNPHGNVMINSANFGARPFFYNARSILQAAGVDVTNFVPGWGIHTAPDPTPTTRPELIVSSISATTLTLSQVANIVASASDAEDGALTSAITWRIDDAATGVTGANFTFTPSVSLIGRHVLRASITDSAGSTDSFSIVIQVIDADEDGDGLLTADEISRGTNPYDPDTDHDGLLDGAEVLTYLSNPLLADTDADGMGDAFEVANGTAINSDDAAGDLDNDGYGNLEELIGGSNPNNALSYPARRVAVLSTTDRNVNAIISADQRGFGAGNAGVGGQRAARSDIALQPGGGFYYYEGRREVVAQNLGFGVATAAVALDTFAGSSNLSAGVNTMGTIFYNGMQQSTFNGNNADTYGIAVDYRGANPTVYIIASTTTGGPGVLLRTIPMTAVTSPVYMFVFGYRIGTTAIQQTINTGANLTTTPFRYDARAILTAAGVSGANTMAPGWSERINRLPSVTITLPVESTTTLGHPLTFQATATDADQGTLTSSIRWSDNGVITATGGSFVLSAMVPGTHVIRARIADAAGGVAFATRTVSVLDTGDLDDDNDGLTNSQELTAGTNPNDSDSDDDGLLDGAEVNTHHTNPLAADTDHDGINDAWELSNGLDPSFADAGDDDDGDGYSNLEEYLGGTNPQNANVFPGPARITRLSETDRHAQIVLSSDRLSITIIANTSGWAHHGVRSDVSVAPGSGFFYYEGRRNVGPADYSFGVGTSGASLERFLGGDSQGLGLNCAGQIFYNNAANGAFTAANADTYGFAVDYRGATPIVYVIASTTSGGPGVLIRTVNMTTVNTPLFIMLTGVRSGAVPQQTINPGNDLVARPFRYDPVSILTAAGVPGASTLELGWTY